MFQKITVKKNTISNKILKYHKKHNLKLLVNLTKKKKQIG